MTHYNSDEKEAYRQAFWLRAIWRLLPRPSKPYGVAQRRSLKVAILESSLGGEARYLQDGLGLARQNIVAVSYSPGTIAWAQRRLRPRRAVRGYSGDFLAVLTSLGEKFDVINYDGCAVLPRQDDGYIRELCRYVRKGGAFGYTFLAGRDTYHSDEARKRSALFRLPNRARGTCFGKYVNPVHRGHCPMMWLVTQLT